jgi:hypothetical protein
MMDPAGVTTTVSARYTFVYTYKDGAWKIQHHHSSALPEGSPSAMPPTDHKDAPVVAQPIDQPSKAPVGSASVTAAGVPDTVIRLGKATRTPQSYLGRGQRLEAERETVGIKVCASDAQSERSFELTDPAPQSAVNDAALKWARASRWDVIGTPSEGRPICAQVIVRFSATQP